MKIKDNNYKSYENLERNSGNIIEFPRQYICGTNALDFADSEDVDIESVDFELFKSELFEPKLLDSKAIDLDREIMSGEIISYPKEGLLSDIFSYAGVIASVVIIMSEILKWMMFM